jgi:hypothetical protein
VADKSLRLPWTGEFSPGQLRGDHPLRDVLELVVAHEGDRPTLLEAIRLRWFTDSAKSRSDPQERLIQQQKRAGNVVIGMHAYGLIDDDTRLTPLGQELAKEPDDTIQAAKFASHLLKHCHGLELLNVVRDLQSRRVHVQKKSLHAEMRRRGFYVNRNSGDEGKVRRWLGLAGVIDDKWVIDEARVAELAGASLASIGEWQSFTRAERALLATLRRLADLRGSAPIPSPTLLDFVRDEHGDIFDESQVKAKVYKPLADAGWIIHTFPKGGRGGKGGEVAAASKLLDVDFEVLTGFKPGDLPADLRAAMATPLDEIYLNMALPGKNRSETYKKGIALELLALNLALDLGLVPLRLRVRGVATGGAEVDLVAEGAHLHFHRWLFQCKNTSRVDVGVLAKEIGMATLLQAQVIVIATTGTVTKPVRSYAERVSVTTPFQVVLVERDGLEEYRTGGPLALRDRFRSDARLAMQLKRPQVDETLLELAEDNS